MINEIKTFSCGFCHDDIGRTRQGLREHLKQKHLKNEIFNTGQKKIKREEILWH